MSEEKALPQEVCDGGAQETEGDLHSVLAAMVEQARALATRLSGDPEQETPCHFCGSPLPLWENLMVLQLTGVAAHVQCPPEDLEAKLREVGPDHEFPYEEFSRAVDERLKTEPTDSCSGTIEI